MASAFEGVVKSVVRELDHSGELIPTSSLRNSTSFQPYCLLGRKSSSSWFWRPRYVCVNLSIRDILEPNIPEPAVECVGHFHFQDAVDGKLQGSVELVTPGQGTFAGGAAVSGSSSASMNVSTLRVSPNTWVAMLQERRLQQPEHKVLQQLRAHGDDVFVVTEVLQTQKEVEVTRTHKREGSGQFALPGVMCLQGKGQGHLSQKKTVTIPSGSILAFRVAQLVITGSELDDQPQESSTFSTVIKSISDRLKILSDGPTKDWLVPTEDFQGLKMEVMSCAKGLENFSKMLCGQLLGALGQVLRDQEALQVLEEAVSKPLGTGRVGGVGGACPRPSRLTAPPSPKLEQGQCCGQVEPLPGPAGAILECLVLPCRALVEELASPIFYLLEALAALSETQHVLLAQMLEARALMEPFKLVESLLEQSVPWKESGAVSLPPGLLGSSWGSEAPTWVLLEECGLELQVGAPQVCWKPEAQGCTCALYACLALLLMLSQLC
uniref:Gasdermin D n=1 Tax=Rhinolophus ferrumequinum TaxID=59479 RepID=A0A671FEM9_RHIFE